METDLQEELRAILKGYHMYRAASSLNLAPGLLIEVGGTPQLTEAQAIASLTSLIDREVATALLKHMNQARRNRIQNLTPGGSDNDTRD